MSTVLFVIPSEVIGSYPSPTDKVVITGEFDNWEHSDYVLQYYENEGYKVEIPRINGKKRTMFKLVINDQEWITLAFFETAVDDSGHTNNVLNYDDYEMDASLDDITISSIRDENEQQEQLLSYAAEVGDNQFLSHEIFPKDQLGDQLEERLDEEHTSEMQAGMNDYVNISSHGELSSTEDLDFDPCESDLDLEGTIQYDSNVSFHTNQRPLNGLVTIVKKARTYWHN